MSTANVIPLITKGDRVEVAIHGQAAAQPGEVLAVTDIGIRLKAPPYIRVIPWSAIQFITITTDANVKPKQRKRVKKSGQV